VIRLHDRLVDSPADAVAESITARLKRVAQLGEKCMQTYVAYLYHFQHTAGPVTSRVGAPPHLPAPGLLLAFCKINIKLLRWIEASKIDQVYRQVGHSGVLRLARTAKRDDCSQAIIQTIAHWTRSYFGTVDVSVQGPIAYIDISE